MLTVSQRHAAHIPQVTQSSASQLASQSVSQPVHLVPFRPVSLNEEIFNGKRERKERNFFRLLK